MKLFINTVPRVRGILVEKNRILFVKRTKDSETYWVAPGGMVENSEDAGQTLYREFLEETGLEVELLNLEFINNLEKFYTVKRIGGTFGKSTGDEFTNPDPAKFGTFELDWISLSQVSRLHILPDPLKIHIVKKYDL